ncbi:hypothetical protein BDN72DRAFT_854244 [Pluteus cervinus]|uniref:Uncharacterized protein n=1 Tax=Pluteus cervinus TaxID=181527 RepID=A0ACD3B7I9_9AGAR|nr:hypothetical protein BDN72DRAFT_854244 [Pluteus cervinus]
MYSTLLSVALFVATAAQVVLAEFAVNNPDVTQCQSAHVSWQPTTGPYNVYVVNPDDPCGPEITHLGQFDTTVYDFQAPFPTGLKIQFYIEDNAGDEAWSAPITVGSSSDSSCVLPTLIASGSGSPSSGAGSPSTHASTSASPSGSVAAIGAANAGKNPFANAAPSSRQITAPVFALGAVAALAAYVL